MAFWSRKPVRAPVEAVARGDRRGRAAAGWHDAGRPAIEDDPIVDHMVAKGMISRLTGVSVSMEARVTGQRVGDILVRQGFVEPDALVRAMIENNPEDLAGQRLAGTLIPVDVLRDLKIVVAAVAGKTIYVASPSEEDVVTDAVLEHYPGHQVDFVAYEPDALEPYIAEVERVTRGDVSTPGIGPDPVMRILSRAIMEGATDVHVEPKERSFTVFFRKLGERVHVYEGTLEEHNVLLTRIKDRSHMDISLQDEDQDGSFQFEHAGRQIDIRTATVPNLYGEKLTMRVLDPSKAKPRLEQLGITRLEHWRRATSRKHGLCLVCGETGSGKTTTLHCTLASENRFSDAIFTIENPVELRSAYVTQGTVNDANGMTGSRFIRAYMRQDPDTIVVGEIRDPDTCNVAVTAAETGHMVLGTVHTNDVRGAIARLESLGAPDYKIRDLLRGVLMQTLVKTICGTCGGHGRLVDGRPCPDVICGGSGYAGRTIVSECMSFDRPEQIDAVLRSSAAVTWPLMVEDAVGKMVEGVTTSDEVQRHFGAEFEDAMKARGLSADAFSLDALRARPR